MRARIRFKQRSRVFDLSATSIDEATNWLIEGLREGGVDKSDSLRMRLLFEEVLLNMAAHYGEQAKATAFLERRQGHYRLRLVLDGERFNPLKRESEEEVWPTSLFSIIDYHIQYSYSRGMNVVRLSMPHTATNPVFKIAIALIVGMILGLLGNAVIPNEIQEAISGAVLTPIANMWVRLLQTISGPVIFLVAVMATFDTRRIKELGGSRFSALARYFTFSLSAVVFTLLCSALLFPLDIKATEASGSVVSNVLDDVLQIVPSNLLEPFVTANTPQLLIIAIATGYLLASIESQIGELKTIIGQLNVLGLTAARLVCDLVPIFVGLLLCLKLWTHDTALLGAIWAPFIVAIALSIMVLSIAILVTSVRFRISPVLLAKKLKGPFVDALKRGALDFSSINDLATSCKRMLGVDDGFARAILPQGLFLYMPTSAVGICVFVFYVAQIQHINVDQTWVVSVVVLSVVLAVATPPVTGANLLSFVMIFMYLGISTDVILDVMIFDIVFGVICIAFDQAMMQIDSIYQAEHMGFLDEEVLRAPLESA